MAHKIRTDLQIDTLVGSGTRPLAVNSAGIVIEQVATDKTEGTRLATRNTALSQNAWVAFANATPSTYLLVAATTDPGLSWSDDGLPANTAWHGSINMPLYSHQKVLGRGKSGFAIDAAVKINAPDNSPNNLFRCNVNSGTGVIVDHANLTENAGWYTGSAGFDGYTLRLAQESGAFNNGTISVIGYKYP